MSVILDPSITLTGSLTFRVEASAIRAGHMGFTHIIESSSDSIDIGTRHVGTLSSGHSVARVD